MRRIGTWVKTQPLRATIAALAGAMTLYYGWAITDIQRSAQCRADYDDEYNSALYARSEAVDVVITSFAEQARNADGGGEATEILAGYLTARQTATDKFPLPAPRRC